MTRTVSHLLAGLLVLHLLSAVGCAQDQPAAAEAPSAATAEASAATAEAPAAAVQELDAQQSQAAVSPTEKPVSQNQPPLQLPDNAAEVDLGKLMDRERRQFTVTLKHTGEQPLLVEQVRSTCPCLEIVEAPKQVTLLPGQDLTLNALLKANVLAVGKFGRLIMVNAKGYDGYFIKVIGEIVRNVSFEPAPVTDLGSFIGQATSWTRTVTLTFEFPEGKQIVLDQPEESKLLAITLSSPAPNTFTITATPKLPLPTGKLNDIITLPTRGVDGYGPVQIAFRGTVTGWDVTIAERTVTVDTAKVEPGKSSTAEVAIIPRSEAPQSRGLARRFGAHTHAKHDDRVAESHVENEEKTAGEMKNQAAWQEIAKAITAELPAGCTWEAVPENECIKLRLTFPEHFFAQRKRYPAIVKYDNKTIGRLTIIGK